MMATIAQLIVELKASTRGLTKGLKAATGRIGDFARRSISELKKLALIGFGAISAAAIGFLATARKIALSWDEIIKSARSLGISTNEMKAIADIADEAGVAWEDVLRTFQQLIAKIQESAGGKGEARDVLIEMFGDPAALQRISKELPIRQIISFAKALRSIEDPARRVFILGRISRTARDMGQLFDEIANGKIPRFIRRNKELGASMNRREGRNVEAFNDEIETLKDTLFGLGTVIVKEVVEPLRLASVALREKLADPAVKESILEFVRSIGAAIKRVRDELSDPSFADKISALINQIKDAIDGLLQALDRVRAFINSPTFKRIEFTNKAIQALSPLGAPRRAVAAANAVLPGGSDLTRKIAETLQGIFGESKKTNTILVRRGTNVQTVPLTQ